MISDLDKFFGILNHILSIFPETLESWNSGIQCPSTRSKAFSQVHLVADVWLNLLWNYFQKLFLGKRYKSDNNLFLNETILNLNF